MKLSCESLVIASLEVKFNESCSVEFAIRNVYDRDKLSSIAEGHI